MQKIKEYRPQEAIETHLLEFHISKNDAMRRERYFKTNMGKKAMKLMTRESRVLLVLV